MTKNKNKSFLFVVLGAILLVILTLIITSTSQIGELCKENPETGDFLCFDRSTNTEAFAIFLSDTTPQQGDTVRVSLAVLLPSFDSIESATISLKNKDTGLIVNKWDFTEEFLITLSQNKLCGQKECLTGSGPLQPGQQYCTELTGSSCSSFGTSIDLGGVLSFKAPAKQGNYEISYVVTGKKSGSTRTLLRENVNFAVGSIGCPEPSCTGWEIVNNIDGGSQSIRSCTDYDSSCREETVTEFKTVCSNNYYVKGKGTRTAYQWLPCEKQETTTTPSPTPSPEPNEPTQTFTCYYCGLDGALSDITQSVPCQAPLSENTLDCTDTTTNPPVTCETNPELQGCGEQALSKIFSFEEGGYGLITIIALAFLIISISAFFIFKK